METTQSSTRHAYDLFADELFELLKTQRLDEAPDAWVDFEPTEKNHVGVCKIVRQVGSDPLQSDKATLIKILSTLTERIEAILSTPLPRSRYGDKIAASLYSIETIANAVKSTDIASRVSSLRHTYFPSPEPMTEPPLLMENLSQDPLNKEVPTALRQHLKKAHSASALLPNECVAITRTDQKVRFGKVFTPPEIIGENRRYLAAYRKKNGTIKAIEEALIFIKVDAVGMRAYAPYSAYRIQRIPRTFSTLVEDHMRNIAGGDKPREPKRERPLVEDHMQKSAARDKPEQLKHQRTTKSPSK